MSAPFGLIGHQEVVDTVRAFAGHALLLYGPARVGKRPTARLLAALMNCERGVAVGPCGACRSCQGVLHGAHPDLLEIEPRTTTATGKTARRRLIPVAAITEKRDDGREYEQHVIEWLETAPTYARKVVIVDGAEHLNEESANALLKVVEEPPHRALFVFLAEEVQAVLPTIASRAARLGVSAVSDEVLARALVTLGEEDPELLAFAAGRPGVIVERAKAREALHDARVLVEALSLGMLGALEAAEGLEKRFDPRWHPEALQFVLRGEEMHVRAAADRALQRTLAALEQYVSPSLAFQLLALELREALGAA
ncbi:ATP-binding protein [Deinococcus peraridilitoris]|uniref:DNA polymerase III, gamma/tau subunit n=1 Tax=Deinococcus peraridilitoris (strain DSM 19664 / LMG 22246 / CIP 109416 / KR-200) TaxID=937777 RepID=L0A1D5_DEIPD|nr:ATP-binding protein [Deinococcus peraridilitoris]AFZ67264.1 hypothetical protein Deipe_1745 [Deinococcus peraridilitoris DSM 19664]